MSRTVLVTAGGLKGAAPRELNRKVKETLGGARGMPPDAVEALQACQAGANKIIARARRGANITIQLAVQEDPIGGWSGSVLVDVCNRED